MLQCKPCRKGKVKKSFLFHHLEKNSSVFSRESNRAFSSGRRLPANSASVVSPCVLKTPASVRASSIPPSLPLKQMSAFPGYLSSLSCLIVFPLYHSYGTVEIREFFSKAFCYFQTGRLTSRYLLTTQGKSGLYFPPAHTVQNSYSAHTP